MTLFISDYMDLDVAIASLSGSLIYILTQKEFDRVRQPVFFFVSFTMGIIGADITLVLVNRFIPDVFSNNERAIGAFLCSALVITTIIKIISFIESIVPGKKTKKGI